MSLEYDYTVHIMPLYEPSRPEEPWPMFSYSTPSDYYWNGLANALRKRGFDNEEIKIWLQSKEARHFLDGYGDEIATLAEKHSQEITRERVNYLKSLERRTP